MSASGDSIADSPAYSAAAAAVDDIEDQIRDELAFCEEQSKLPPIYVSEAPIDRMIGTTGRPVMCRPKPQGHWTAKELFGQPTTDNFRSLDEFVDQVAINAHHPNLRASMGMTEGSGPAGGYAVPTVWSSTWLDTMLEQSVVMSRATIIPMTVSDKLRIPGFDGLDHTGGSLLGGITGGWIPESGDIGLQTPKVRYVDMKHASWRA